MRDARDVLDTFRLGVLQSFKQIISALDRNDISINQAIVVIDEMVSDTLKGIHTVGPKRLCPVCSEVLGRYNVNTSRCNQVNSGLTEQWVCSSSNCDYEEFR